jgi:hypothetical protein
MRPVSVGVGPYIAGVSNGISTFQTLAQAGPFLINGTLAANGVAVLDAPRQIGVTSSGNDSNVLFTITGTDALSNPLGEQIRGLNVGTATTNNLFKRVTGVTANGATSSATIGTVSAPFISRMIRMDEWANEAVGVQVSVSGTTTFTIQHSFDDPNDLVNPVPIGSMFWDTSLIPAGGILATTGYSFSIATAPLWMRLVLNSATGSARMTVTQYNVVYS